MEPSRRNAVWQGTRRHFARARARGQAGQVHAKSASGPHLSILISHAYPSLASPYFVVRSFSDLTPFLVIKENSIATSSATVCTAGVCAYPMRANKHGA